MNVLNLRTGEPFDPLPRLHHREESALQVSSSEHSARSRGMLLAAKSFYIGGKKWTNPYVTDGLVAMWDGEWNAGGGRHDSNPSVWIDLSGNGNDATKGDESFAFDDNSLVYDGSTTKCWKVTSISARLKNLVATIGKYSTVEFACRRTTIENNSLIFYIKGNSVKSTLNARFAGGTLYFTTGTLGQRYVQSLKSYGFSAIWSDETIVNVASRYRYAYYIRGILISDTGIVNGQPNRFALDGPFVFGSVGQNEYMGSWSGSLYCLRIYDRELSASEIAANYAVDKARFGIY